METINPLTSIFPVSSATPQGRGRGQPPQTLVQGQLFKALVVENSGPERYLLDIGGNKLAARSEAALAAGQTLRLEVVKTSPEIELKIVADPLGQFGGRSLTLLGKNLDISTLFQGLQQQTPPLMDTLTPTSRNVIETFFTLQQSDISAKEGGAVLRQLIQNLGINLEQLLANGDKNAALRTLKAALLEVATHFKSAESIADTTSKMLTTLELFQLVQLQTSVEGQYVFPLPLPFLEQGYLVVERDPKDDSSGSWQADRRFSLHLTLSDLGNLQVDFLHNSEGLFIRFFAENRETADFIAGYSEELKAEIMDIPLIHVSFSGDAPDPISELIKQVIPEGGAMLDTKV
jgi:hypothetical protein